MMICIPHFERTGKTVEAQREIAGTPMCAACFAGRPINPLEDMVFSESERELVRSTHYRRQAGLGGIYPSVRRKAHA